MSHYSQLDIERQNAERNQIFSASTSSGLTFSEDGTEITLPSETRIQFTIDEEAHMERETTNEILKATHPGLHYVEIKVDRADHLRPFDGHAWSDTGLDGYLHILDPINGDEIMVIAEIIDDHTILVGRIPPHDPV